MDKQVTEYQLPTTLSIDQATLAWLGEKSGRSESMKTRTVYEATLHAFRAMLQRTGLDLDSEPALIAPFAQGWAGYSAREGHTVLIVPPLKDFAIMCCFLSPWQRDAASARSQGSAISTCVTMG